MTLTGLDIIKEKPVKMKKEVSNNLNFLGFGGLDVV